MPGGGKRGLAVAALFLVAAAWGATFTLVKDVLRQIAPEPFLFARFTVAGLVLCAIALYRRQLHRSALLAGLILGLFVFGGYWMQTRGLLSISPSRSALLTGLYVVFVPFCDRLLRGTRVTPHGWAGSVLAVIGTFLLVGGFDARPSGGDLLTIACAFCFALHVVYSAGFTTRHSPLGLAAVQVLVVGGAALVPSLFARRMPAGPKVIVVILFTAIVTTALAFVAMMWGQARVSATEAAVILAFEPVAAAVTSIAFYGEAVTRPFLCGGMLILLGMVVSQLGGTVELKIEN